MNSNQETTEAELIAVWKCLLAFTQHYPDSGMSGVLFFKRVATDLNSRILNVLAEKNQANEINDMLDAIIANLNQFRVPTNEVHTKGPMQ